MPICCQVLRAMGRYVALLHNLRNALHVLQVAAGRRLPPQVVLLRWQCSDGDAQVMLLWWCCAGCDAQTVAAQVTHIRWCCSGAVACALLLM